MSNPSLFPFMPMSRRTKGVIVVTCGLLSGHGLKRGRSVHKTIMLYIIEMEIPPGFRKSTPFWPATANKKDLL